MNFNETPEFLRDFKRLRKKYKSLPGDMANFRKAVGKEPVGISKHLGLIYQFSQSQIRQ